MADQKTFSHIVVSADDDDDFVIQAGVRSSESSEAPVVEPAPACEPDAAESGPVRIAADKSMPRNLPLDHTEQKRPVQETLSEQQLDDLSDVPLPKTQKVVLLGALIFIVGFAVYYFFIMH